MLRARFTEYVTVPHLTAPVLNTDEAILAAYRSYPGRITGKAALRQARSRGTTHIWTVWDGDRPTDIRMTNEYWCEQEIKRMGQEPVLQVTIAA